MKKLVAIIAATALIGIIAFTAVMRWHNRSLSKLRQEITLEEFAWSWQLMHMNPTDALLREHLKARLYYYAGKIPDSILKNNDTLDFGPIDETLLGPYRAAPGHADYPNDYYISLMKRVRKETEQGGAGYPPQGVGSPDP